MKKSDIAAGAIVFIVFGLIFLKFSRGLSIVLFVIGFIFIICAVAYKPKTEKRESIIMVYISKNGNNYHYNENCAGKHPRRVLLEYAKKRNYKPCQKCYKNEVI